jgi:hypothetical protein
MFQTRARMTLTAVKRSARLRHDVDIPPLSGDGTLSHQRSTGSFRQLRPRTRTPAARPRRARHRQDAACRSNRRSFAGAAHLVEREEHDAGPRRALRLRYGAAAVRLSLWRRRHSRHPPLHQARTLGPSHQCRRANGAPHRRDRQGRPGVSQRSLARARSHAFLDHGNRRRDHRQAAPSYGDVFFTSSTFPIANS